MGRYVTVALVLALVILAVVGCGVAVTVTPAPTLPLPQAQTDVAWVATHDVSLTATAAVRTPTAVIVRPTPTSNRKGEYVTLDGSLDVWDTTLFTKQRIELWKECCRKGADIAAVARHGERVMFIGRVGDVVLIRLENGIEGWVHSYRIKELRRWGRYPD